VQHAILVYYSVDFQRYLWHTIVNEYVDYQEGEMTMRLEDALLEYAQQPVLIEDGANNWEPSTLRDELDRETLDKDVYACSDYVADIDEHGYQVTPHMFTIVNIGEDPYFVVRKEDGSYRVRFMENPQQEHSRLIHGQSRFEHKQGAYRRKSYLRSLKLRKTPE
jgi:hypothetical protein